MIFREPSLRVGNPPRQRTRRHQGIEKLRGRFLRSSATEFSSRRHDTVACQAEANTTQSEAGLRYFCILTTDCHILERNDQFGGKRGAPKVDADVAATRLQARMVDEEQLGWTWMLLKERSPDGPLLRHYVVRANIEDHRFR
jgi:hypothetical protein